MKNYDIFKSISMVILDFIISIVIIWIHYQNFMSKLGFASKLSGHQSNIV